MGIFSYADDIETILSHRFDQGGDLWATQDERLLKGSPFSTLDCANYLVELGVSQKEQIMLEIADLLFRKWQKDGRFKVYPSGGMLPCQSAIVLEVLCKMGYVQDPRIQKTFQHFYSTQQEDGGWKCNKYSFGRGPETEYSNPLPTLNVLGAYRFLQDPLHDSDMDRAVEFLLQHWTIRKPIGPCHYGIGSLFMQVEYPFRNYNLFSYVYILSFYPYARKDPRFLEAFAALQTKTVDGNIVVERVVSKLANLSFCKKGETSELATMRYQEILENLKQ